MLNEYAQIAHQKFLAREREKLRADKQLRDAAPELLAALKGIATQYQKDLARNPQLCPLLRPVSFATIRAAIAKAEGTS